MGLMMTVKPEIPTGLTANTLMIRMTRKERRIKNEFYECFGHFERVVIYVDEEEHVFDADTFIGLLESYEEG